MSLTNLGIAIVGAGPAGLAAGIHAARAGIAHLVFDAGPPGGLLRAANRVENYPGYSPGVPGAALADAIARQAQALGVRHCPARVESVSVVRGRFVLKARGVQAAARAVILATGTRPVDPQVPGSRAAVRKGLCHNDVRTLPRALAGAKVLVSGGGDAAFDAALSAKARGARVEIYMRTAEIKANRVLTMAVGSADIPINECHVLKMVETDSSGLRISMKCRRKTAVSATCDHLLLCHGREPETRLYRAVAGDDAPLPIDVETPVPGLYCAGDLIRGPCRYAVVAAADGTRACHLAGEYLKRMKNEG